MNILFLSRLFYPHIGGVEKHVMEVSKRLVEKGHKVTIITEELPTKDIPVYLQSRNKIPLREKINSIEIYRIPDLKENWFKKFQIWKWMWKNKELIRKADIVHCHDVFFWYLPFKFLFLRKLVYTTFHGYEDYPLKLKFIIMHKISETLSLGNICIGDFMKKWYGTKPNYVTYGAVNIVKSEKLKVKSSESTVFIGRLDEQTGIKTYVNAVRLIKKKIPNFDLTVIGDGKFRKEIEKDFKVLGFKKNPQDYFRQYRFAFVSRYLSILEAMAAKRLVFAVYDNPIKEDYLKITPFSKLINIVNSENELAERVLHFLKNPKEEEKIINRAFEWVKTRDWENVVKLYLSLWKTS